MGGSVLAHFYAYPAPAHLVGNGGRGAGAEEAVEDEVAGIRGDVQDALKQALGFGGAETTIGKQGQPFQHGFLVVS